MAFWVELHCDRRGDAVNRRGDLICEALNGNQPGVLVENTTAHLMIARKNLHAEAKRRGYRKVREGWTCPSCLKEAENESGVS